MIEGQFKPLQRLQFTSTDLTLPGIIPLFQTSTISENSAVVAWPTVAAGDFIILLDGVYKSSGGAPAAVTPTGFTQLTTQGFTVALTGGRVSATYKICDGTESGNITGMSPNAGGAKVALVFRSAPVISSINAVGWTGNCTDGNPTSVTPTTASVLPNIFFGFVFNNAAGGTSFSTASPAFDTTVASSGASHRGLVGYKSYIAGSISSHTIDMDDLGAANGVIGGYIEFS